MEFSSPPHLISGGKGSIIMQLIQISTLKNNKLKNWSVGIFHFTFGQLAYWSEQEKGANLKDQIEMTIWSQFKVLIAQSIFHYFKIINNFSTTFCLSGIELVRVHWGTLTVHQC